MDKLLVRALAAYYKSGGIEGGLQPSTVEHDEKLYIFLKKNRTTHAIYRVRIVYGNPVLKRLVRDPLRKVTHA